MGRDTFVPLSTEPTSALRVMSHVRAGDRFHCQGQSHHRLCHYPRSHHHHRGILPRARFLRSSSSHAQQVSKTLRRFSSLALVAMVGGNHPPVSPADVHDHLESFNHVLPEAFTVSRYAQEDSLCASTLGLTWRTSFMLRCQWAHPSSSYGRDDTSSRWPLPGPCASRSFLDRRGCWRTPRAPPWWSASSKAPAHILLRHHRWWLVMTSVSTSSRHGASTPCLSHNKRSLLRQNWSLCS